MSFRDLDQTAESRARLRRSVAREIQERSLATSRSTAAWAPCHVREIDTRIRHRLRPLLTRQRARSREQGASSKQDHVTTDHWLQDLGLVVSLSHCLAVS